MIRKPKNQSFLWWFICLLFFIVIDRNIQAETLKLTLRNSNDSIHEWKDVEWNTDEVAVIICDMWDSHHSVTAVRRVNEFAPRLNQVIKSLRKSGVTIIHSPSDCMPSYKDHDARKRALATPVASNLPKGISSWCHRIPEEEKASYPIDQSDGGEDEDEFENYQWAESLKSEGRNPGTPWLRQTPALEILDKDYIAAEGDVVWNILKDNKIKHVILSGVHTNMCVLGRPFGLRQMIRFGMDTVLMRDGTDVMYNPKKWPYVSHFTGLDLVIRHIEENVCSTVTTDQIIGGAPFRFTHDKRPHLSIVSSSKKMKKWRALSRRFFDSDFCVSYVNSEDGRGKYDLQNADCILLSDPINDAKLNEFVQSHIGSAKPVIGTGKFCSESMSQVFGIQRKIENNKIKTQVLEKMHPLVAGFKKTTWPVEGIVGDFEKGAGFFPLFYGKDQGSLVSWSFVRPDGGKSCATTLDVLRYKDKIFFQRFLFNAVRWSTAQEIKKSLPMDPDIRRSQEGWAVLGSTSESSSKDSKFRDLRTLIRVPDSINQTIRLLKWKSAKDSELYINGEKLKEGKSGEWSIPSNLLKSGDLNLLVVRLGSNDPFKALPTISDSQSSIEITSTYWQERFSNQESIDIEFPIPPQFGAPTDLIQEWTQIK